MIQTKNKSITTTDEKKQECPELQHLVQVIAHDLKSPLSSSVFLLSMLLSDKDIEKNDLLKSHVYKIYEANVHLAEMITLMADHIQDSLKRQRKEQVNTLDLLKQSISIMPDACRQQFILEGDFPILYTNKMKLQNVFEILFSYFVANKAIHDKIIIGVTNKDKCCEFHISHSIHIQAPNIQKIFLSREYSETEKQQPSKISLNMLKLLIEGQCGKLWQVESSEAKNIIYFEWLK